MRHLRRHDLAPRVELLPLLDVVFLLLTFFIYSLIVMRYLPNVLPVKLTPVTMGQTATATELQIITVDRSGEVFFNRERIEPEAIDARLKELAEKDSGVKLMIAMEEFDATESAPGDLEPGRGVDRGPVLMDLIGRVRRAGIDNFGLIGESKE